MQYIIKTPQQLGAVIRGFRREKKLIQSELGSRVGFAQNVISDIERNPGPTGFARISRLLAALDLELIVRPRTGKPGRDPS